MISISCYALIITDIVKLICNILLGEGIGENRFLSLSSSTVIDVPSNSKPILGIGKTSGGVDVTVVVAVGKQCDY